MAKRSPILGYNHNVRYRGLIFHVQTEDSGVLSPHLFTHLFHEGVIVSTRKLVYDAGASEEAIKSLMQSQHKAVMKDLKKHTFDDKIDQYLSGVEGLLPRGAKDDGEVPVRPSDPGLVAEPATVPVAMPPELAPPEVAEAPRTRRKSSGAPPVGPKSRTQTAERTSKPSQIRNLPPPPEDDAPTLVGSDAANIAAEPAAMPAPATNTPVTQPRTLAGAQLPPQRPTGLTPLRTLTGAQQPPVPRTMTGAQPPLPRTTTGAQPPLQRPGAQPHGQQPVVPRTATGSQPALSRTVTPPPKQTSRPGIGVPQSFPEIQILEDELSGRTRAPRDTAVEEAPSFGAVPAPIGDNDATRPSDGIPSRPGDSIPPLPPAPERRPPGPSRPPSHGAATLPPMRQPSRPAITPPTVMSRPIPNDPRSTGGGDSDAVEVYAPPPPSTEPPPGERAERPGQYSVSRRAREQVQADVPMREHTGRIAIPAGLGRPQRSRTGATIPPGSGPIETKPPPTQIEPRSRTPSIADGVPRPNAPAQPPSDGVPQPRQTAMMTAQRSPHVTAQIASRTGAGSGAPSSGNSGGVVMSRPAVIVGAPPKVPGPPTTQRVRKAREDEGRGFGQGLISEKSLDEVILAYLSEDGEEK